MSILRSLTHARETGSRNRRHNFDARFRYQFFVPMHAAFGTRRQSTTLEVVHRHEKLAPVASNLDRWRRFQEPFLERVSGALEMIVERKLYLRRQRKHHFWSCLPIHGGLPAVRRSNETSISGHRQIRLSVTYYTRISFSNSIAENIKYKKRLTIFFIYTTDDDDVRHEI